MDILLYGALLISQLGICGKQYAMKRCGALAPGAFNSICINLFRSGICLIVSLVIWAFADGTDTTVFGYVIAAAGGIGTALSLFSWILSSQRISLTLIEGISAIGSLVIPLILAPYLSNGESVTPIQWVGTALLFISLFLFGEKDTKDKSKNSIFSGIALAALCALGVMVALVAKKLYTYHITSNGLGSIEFFTLIGFVGVLLTFLVLLPIYYRSERIKSEKTSDGTSAAVSFPLRRIWVFIIIAAVSLYVYELFVAYASTLPSAIYYPLSKAASIVGCFLLDIIVFKDRITPKKAIGLSLLLVSVVLITV